MKIMQGPVLSISFKSFREKEALKRKAWKKEILSLLKEREKVSSMNAVEDMCFSDEGKESLECLVSREVDGVEQCETDFSISDEYDEGNQESPEPWNLESDSGAFQILSNIRIEFAKKILCRVPELEPHQSHYCSFNDSSFVSYFRNKHELMQIILSSFSVAPFIDLKLKMSPVRQLENWLEEIHSHRAFHGNIKMTKAEVEEVFFSTFNWNHFILGQTELELHPVGLYTINEHFEEDWKKTKIGVKDKTFGTLSNRFRSDRFYRYLTRLHECREPRNIHCFIEKYFRDAWKLQSDGDQTNATLVRKSLLDFAEFLSKYLVEEDRIIDLGSSYGSLIWIVVATLNTKIKNVSGEGWEYGEQRHKLGLISTLRMLRDTCEIAPEYRSLLTYDVDLKWRNIMDWKSLGPSNSIAFCFDKAFPTALLLHVLFQIITSTKIRIFISCKEFFSKGKHRCSLYGCEFKYGDLMRHLERYFVKKETLKNLHMRYNNESAGAFSVFEVVRHTDVDGEFLDRLYTTFFENIGLDQRDMERIKDSWDRAKECHDYPVSRNRSIEKAIQFYEDEKSLIEKEIEIYSQSKRKKQKKVID